MIEFDSRQVRLCILYWPWCSYLLLHS